MHPDHEHALKALGVSHEQMRALEAASIDPAMIGGLVSQIIALILALVKKPPTA